MKTAPWGPPAQVQPMVRRKRDHSAVPAHHEGPDWGPRWIEGGGR